MHDIADSRYPHVAHEPGKGPEDARVLGTGMRVWEIAWAARHYQSLGTMSRELAVDLELLDEGMRYAAEYPAEVDAAIEENESWTFERSQRVLPGIELFEPSLDSSRDSG